MKLRGQQDDQRELSWTAASSWSLPPSARSPRLGRSGSGWRSSWG